MTTPKTVSEIVDESMRRTRAVLFPCVEERWWPSAEKDLERIARTALTTLLTQIEGEAEEKFLTPITGRYDAGRNSGIRLVLEIIRKYKK